MDKETRKRNEETALTIFVLVHEKNRGYKWTDSTLDALCKSAKREKVSLVLINSPEEAKRLCAPDDCVIVCGVDREWLLQSVNNLLLLGVKVVLLENQTKDCFEGVNRIHFCQDILIDNCVRFLKEKGRTSPALFGVQLNDASDSEKALRFAKMFPKEDIYWVYDTPRKSFEAFFEHIEKYDSVICVNDIMAVLLLKFCKEQKIEVPNQLCVMGNGNLVIGMYTSPTITTADYDRQESASIIIRFCRDILKNCLVQSADLRFNLSIVERGSTGNFEKTEPSSDFRCKRFFGEETGKMVDFSEYETVKKLDRCLTDLTNVEFSVLKMLVGGDTYEEMANKIFLSVDTVKYHVKKLYRIFGVSKRVQLEELFENYGIKL